MNIFTILCKIKTMKKELKPKTFSFKTLGLALITYRTENNLSFTDVSKKCKVDRAVLHRIETGLPTGVNSTLAICHEIGKPFELFLK